MHAGPDGTLETLSCRTKAEEAQFWRPRAFPRYERHTKRTSSIFPDRSTSSSVKTCSTSALDVTGHSVLQCNFYAEDSRLFEFQADGLEFLLNDHLPSFRSYCGFWDAIPCRARGGAKLVPHPIRLPVKTRSGLPRAGPESSR